MPAKDDMRYVVCTFVVMPRRWIDAYGWRRLSRHEIAASAVHYTLGGHMGIKGVPESYEEFEACLDVHEEAHFGWDENAPRVSDATLDLMASWYPCPCCATRHAPYSTTRSDASSVTRRRARHPHLVRRAVGAIGSAVRLLPPRRAPHFARQNWEIKGYPNGFQLDDLGTRPVSGVRGCPVRQIGPSAIE
ncbi:hypothetical protein ACFVJ4_02000 [Streptomyces sp. NPDC127178]|uniref:hypothetical protein n=1 Tax=unclassified Streptomyces TaxID=2593676 RepID=UPI003643317D